MRTCTCDVAEPEYMDTSRAVADLVEPAAGYPIHTLAQVYSMVSTYDDEVVGSLRRGKS